MVFHWSLSESKSLQVSRTLLCIMADLNNTLVCMVSPRPLSSKSFYQSLGDYTKSTILRIPQRFSITGASPSDCLMPYPRHSLVGFWLFCRYVFGVFYSPILQGCFLLLQCWNNDCVGEKLTVTKHRLFFVHANLT